MRLIHAWTEGTPFQNRREERLLSLNDAFKYFLKSPTGSDKSGSNRVRSLILAPGLFRQEIADRRIMQTEIPGIHPQEAEGTLLTTWNNSGIRELVCRIFISALLLARLALNSMRRTPRYLAIGPKKRLDSFL